MAKKQTPNGFVEANESEEAAFDLLQRAARAAQKVLEDAGRHDVCVWLLARTKEEHQVGTEEHQREVTNTWPSDFPSQVQALDVMLDMSRGVYLSIDEWASETGLTLAMHKNRLSADYGPKGDG